MALVNCSECDNSVSDKATSCPKCGAPIASLKEINVVGEKLNTVQETSKKFKLQTLMSVSMIVVGILWVAASSDPETTQHSSPIPAFMVMVGFIWYVVNRFRIWWHHK